MGIHIQEILALGARMLIESYAKEKKAKGENIPSDVAMRALYLKDRRRRNNIAQAKQIAYSYMENQSEGLAEDLEEACRIAGLVMEEVLDDIQKAPHVQTIIREHGGLSKAEMWLAEALIPGIAVSTRELEGLAKNAGISATTLGRVRARLGIETFQRGRGWWWILPAKPSENGNGHHDISRNNDMMDEEDDSGFSM